jgi:hypothetical protein
MILQKLGSHLSFTTVLETGIKKIAGIFFNIAINFIFDGAKVSKTLALSLSPTFTAIVGGVDPNHFHPTLILSKQMR